VLHVLTRVWRFISRVRCDLKDPFALFHFIGQSFIQQGIIAGAVAEGGAVASTLAVLLACSFRPPIPLAFLFVVRPNTTPTSCHTPHIGIEQQHVLPSAARFFCWCCYYCPSSLAHLSQLFLAVTPFPRHDEPRQPKQQQQQQ